MNNLKEIIEDLKQTYDSDYLYLSTFKEYKGINNLTSKDYTIFINKMKWIELDLLNQKLVIEILQKQIPMEIVHTLTKTTKGNYDIINLCPNCNVNIENPYITYCDCGQKLYDS